MDEDEYDEEDDDAPDDERGGRTLAIPGKELAELRSLEERLKELGRQERALAERTPEYHRLRRNGVDTERAWQIAGEHTFERGPFLHRLRLLKCMRDQEAVVMRARAIYAGLEADQWR